MQTSERKLYTVLRRLLAAEAKRAASYVIAALKEQGIYKASDAGELIADGVTTEYQPTWTARLTDEFQRLLAGAFADGSTTGTQELARVGIAFRVPFVEAEDWAGQYINKELADLLDSGTRSLMRQLVIKALRDGWTERKLEQQLLGQSGPFSAKRARDIAKTELAHAQNSGSLDTYNRSGVVQAVKVYDGKVKKVGEIDQPCKDANGQTWPLEYARQNTQQHPRCGRNFSPIVGSDFELTPASERPKGLRI